MLVVPSKVECHLHLHRPFNSANLLETVVTAIAPLDDVHPALVAKLSSNLLKKSEAIPRFLGFDAASLKCQTRTVIMVGVVTRDHCHSHDHTHSHTVTLSHCQ
jgi:hypothetical protein